MGTEQAQAQATFTAAEVRKLFGVGEVVVRRWLTSGKLAATRVEAAGGVRYAVEPQAVLAFVRAHPDEYDWQKVTDELLGREAERVDRRDPLITLVEAFAGVAPMPTSGELKALEQGGVLVLVRRGGKGPQLVRRSAAAKAKAELLAERERRFPLAALHRLLQADERARNVAVARGEPVGDDEARQNGVVRCTARNGSVLRERDEEGKPIRKCMSCGREYGQYGRIPAVA